MAIHELQTAAAHVLHVEHITDADSAQLRSRFGFHPLDLEGLFTVPIESTFSSYGTYGILTMLWPEVSTNTTSDIRFFLGRHQLVIVGDTIDHRLQDFIETLASNPGDQSEPAMLLQTMVMWLMKDLSDAVGTRAIARHLASVALAVRQLGRWLQDQNRKQAVPLLILTAHRLDLDVDRMNDVVPSPTTSVMSQKLPRFMRSYAVVSAVMVVVVLLTLSLHS